MKSTFDNYTPFGDEWVKEVMKLKKVEIIHMLREQCLLAKEPRDYSKDISFWKRLKSFVKDVQTGCMMGEEEKDMILKVCNEKLKLWKTITNKQ
jgi:hypothetical protein